MFLQQKTITTITTTTHTRTCAYQRVRNNRFSENLAYVVFLEHPFWDSPFYLIYRRITDFWQKGALHFCSLYFFYIAKTITNFLFCINRLYLQKEWVFAIFYKKSIQRAPVKSGTFFTTSCVRFTRLFLGYPFRISGSARGSYEFISVYMSVCNTVFPGLSHFFFLLFC